MKSFLLPILFLSHFCLFAQKDKAIKPINHTIKSKIFNVDRKISVHLPEQYSKDPSQKMVVAYLFDGQFEPYFSMVNGVVDYYSQTETTIPMIIVSIHTENRWAEFVPTSERDSIDTSFVKYTSLLADHLEKEVFPLIESNYRTLPFRLGIGHSLGGTFLLYSIFKKPALFRGIIAASPNMTSNNNELVKLGDEFLQANPLTSCFAYVTAGTVGEMENSFRNSIECFDTIVNKLKLKNFSWSYDKIEGANHMTTFVPALNDGFVLFSQKWNFLDEELRAFKGMDSTQLENAVKECFQKKSVFRGTEMKYSVQNGRLLQIQLTNINEYATAVALVQPLMKLLETDLEFTGSKEELIKKMETGKQYNLCYMYCEKGKQEFLVKNYKASAHYYIQAFETEAKNGTHLLRIQSIPALVQGGYTEEAFKQLDLLANYFELRGNGSFINDLNLAPLHSDPRWKTLMDKLDKNLKKD